MAKEKKNLLEAMKEDVKSVIRIFGSAGKAADARAAFTQVH